MVSFYLGQVENMPKVQDEYLQDKREQILDAAYRVSMQKPIYIRIYRNIDRWYRM